MNKSELIDHVSGVTMIDKKTATAAVDAVLNGIVVTVKAGNKVSLLGFGVFTPTARAARQGRNPRTGAPVKIAASKGVRFAPGSPFKAALNAKSGAKKSAPSKAAKAPAKAAKSSKATAKAAKTVKKR